VNIPLLYEKTAQQIHIALDEGVRIFFTSAGSPKTWTPFLKKEGCRVVHVVSTPEFALKSQDAGVDAVVVEGFEAGGHNGRQELTTFVLLQQCQNLLSIPYIAAGGIASGNAILAALVLGAAGVQMGTAFAAAQESSAHDHFKNSICQASFHSTFLRFKKLLPVRLLDNPFSQKVAEAENLGATKEDLKKLLGKGRARLGMHLGDLEEGELEIGQIASEIKEIKTCADIVAGLQTEYLIAYEKLTSCSYHKEKNF
jgi:enoyl-[acyl-carrier protein] reductase II